jgi:hypothetical protein
MTATEANALTAGTAVRIIRADFPEAFRNRATIESVDSVWGVTVVATIGSEPVQWSNSRKFNLDFEDIEVAA